MGYGPGDKVNNAANRECDGMMPKFDDDDNTRRIKWEYNLPLHPPRSTQPSPNPPCASKIGSGDDGDAVSGMLQMITRVDLQQSEEQYNIVAWVPN